MLSDIQDINYILLVVPDTEAALPCSGVQWTIPLFSINWGRGGGRAVIMPIPLEYADMT